MSNILDNLDAKEGHKKGHKEKSKEDKRNGRRKVFFFIAAPLVSLFWFFTSQPSVFNAFNASEGAGSGTGHSILWFLFILTLVSSLAGWIYFLTKKVDDNPNR